MNEIDSDEEFINELVDKKIAELEVDKIDPSTIELIPTVSNPFNRTLDINDDYNLARTSIRNQLQLFDKASREALVAVMESQNPGTIEAFSILMSHMTTAAEKLMKLQSDTNKASGMTLGNKSPSNIPNNGSTFVGSTNDMLERIGGSLDPIMVIENDGTEETSS